MAGNMASNFRNPPLPPFEKGGWGDFEEFMHTPIFLFGSGPAGLGKVR
jgi:hypothetical protein